MRGQLVSSIKKSRVDIFGGDLSYGRIENPLLKINQENIFYQPATVNYQDASVVYRSSKINLNISALQFDSALNNRFFDIILSGGFLLTDRRGDLNNLSAIANEITYESPEELNEKICFFSSLANKSKYEEIKNQLFEEVAKKSSYHMVIEKIFNAISSHEEEIFNT